MNAISAQESISKKTQGQPGIGEKVYSKAKGLYMYILYSTPFIERTYGSQTHHAEVLFWPFYGNNPRIQDAAAGLNIQSSFLGQYDDVALRSLIFRPSHSQQYYSHQSVLLSHRGLKRIAICMQNILLLESTHVGLIMWFTF